MRLVTHLVYGIGLVIMIFWLGCFELGVVFVGGISTAAGVCDVMTYCALCR